MITKRTCGQCVSRTRHPRRCRRRTCKYGPKCWQHTQIDSMVEVKPSPIHGLGVFAKKNFYRGDIVNITYSGISLTEDQVKNITDTNSIYILFNDLSNRYINAIESNSCIARYINENIRRSNIEFFSLNQNEIGVRVLRTINPRVELVANYRTIEVI